MAMDKIISLSVITSVLFIGIFSLSFVSANANIHFCYDEVGDGHNCFDKKGKCEIAN